MKVITESYRILSWQWLILTLLWAHFIIITPVELNSLTTICDMSLQTLLITFCIQLTVILSTQKTTLYLKKVYLIIIFIISSNSFFQIQILYMYRKTSKTNWPNVNRPHGVLQVCRWKTETSRPTINCGIYERVSLYRDCGINGIYLWNLYICIYFVHYCLSFNEWRRGRFKM